MNAIEILICDSLADSLSKFTFPGDIKTIAAVRRIVPDEVTENLDTLQVSVVPGEVDVSNHTHGADLFEPTVHVVIAKRFDTDAELDSLYDLRSDIVDAIRSKALPASTPPMPPGTHWMGIQNVVTFGRDQVANMRTFLADIAVVYRRSQEKVL
jgi:hypothetical protein